MKQLFTLSFALLFAGAIAQNVPNNSLESWTLQLGTFEDPVNWPSSNYLYFGGSQSVPTVFKCDTAYSGNHSARLVSAPVTSNPLPGLMPDTVALMVSGSIVPFPSPKLSGFAFSQRPAKLEFYAQYRPNGVDTASAGILLTKWNGTKTDTVGYGILQIGNTVTTFTKYEVSITYSSATVPDTAMIIVLSSGFNQPKAGSELIVDAFAFSGGTIGYQEIPFTAPATKHYPNPASAVLNIETSWSAPYMVKVFDITGKEVATVNSNQQKTQVDLKGFQPGLYFYRTLDLRGNLLHTGRFNVVR